MKKIFNILPKKDPVIIHSDLLILGKKILKDKKKLKKVFLKNFSRGLFIPSFNLNKKKNIRFDKYESSMGSLTNLFIKEKKFKRTVNPIHSYIYTGYKLNDLDFQKSSFGENSIFNLFSKKNFIWINLGAINNHGYTIFHHAEELCKVKYRKYVFIKKKIIFKKKKYYITSKYYSRKRKNRYNFDKAINDMNKAKIVKIFKINNSTISFGKCNEIIDFLCNKLIKNDKYLIK